MKISSHTPAVGDVAKDLSLLQDKVYLPTIEDRKLKSEFWAKSRDILALQNKGKEVTLAQAMEYVSAPRRLVDAWGRVGFKEWFINGDEQRQRLEYLFDLSLDAAETILRDPDPKTASAKVNMIKAIAELAKKYPRQGLAEKPNYNNLSVEEIQKLLHESGIKVSVTGTTTFERPSEALVDVTPIDVEK